MIQVVPYESSLVSWFLVLKSEERNKATISHWPKLDTLFACILLQHLPVARASQKAVLDVSGLSFIGSKGALVSLFRTTVRFQKPCSKSHEG